MTPKLRYPNITGRTPEEQIEQLKRYLYQLIDELNFALSTMDTQKRSDSK
jgi:hypothetical protein